MRIVNISLKLVIFLICVVLKIQVWSQPFAPDEHTVALFHFDENTGDVAKDFSVNGNDALLLSTSKAKGGGIVKWSKNGFFSGCIDINNSPVYISGEGSHRYFIAPLKGFNPEEGTIEIFIKDNGSFNWADYLTITDRKSNETNPLGRLSLEITEKGFLFLFMRNRERKNLNIDTSLMLKKDGKWHYVAVTYSASQNYVKLFIDGKQHGTVKPFFNMQIDEPVLVIGGRDIEGSCGCTALIDEVRISDCIREIKEINLNVEQNSSNSSVLFQASFEENAVPGIPKEVKIDAPSVLRSEVLRGKKSICLKEGEEIRFLEPSFKSVDGFSFSIEIAPTWHGNDGKYHHILTFYCSTLDKKKYILSIGKWPSGKIHFAVLGEKGEWVSSVYVDEPLVWVKDEWKFLAGSFGPQGLYIQSNEQQSNILFIPQVQSIREIEQIVIGKENDKVNSIAIKDDIYLRIRNFNVFSGENLSFINPIEGLPITVAGPPRLALSPDLPLLLKGHIKLAPSLMEKKVFLHIDCPLGVAPGFFAEFPAWFSARRPWISSSKSYNNLSYIRYTYQIPTDYGNEFANHPIPFYLCLSTILSEGAEGKIFLSAEYENIKQEPIDVQFKVKKLPPPPRLKRLKVGMTMNYLDLFTQGDYTGFAKRIGLNFLDLWFQWFIPGVISPEPIPIVDQAIGICRREGIIPCVLAWDVCLREADPLPPDLRHTDIEGNLSTSTSSRCPSDRSEEFLRDLEKFRNIGRRGASTTIDIEGPQFFTGCFCTRCLARFKEYWKEKKPRVNFVEPTLFEREPEKYPEHHKLWREFQGELWSEIYTAYYKAFSEGIMQAKNKPKESIFIVYDEGLWPSGANLTRFFSTPRTEVRVFAGPPLYHAPEWNGEVLRTYISQYPNVEVMPYIGFSYDNPIEDMKSNVLEVFGSGAHGILFWSWKVLDGQHIYEIIEALNAVERVEDIIMDGKQVQNVTVMPEGITVNLIKSERKMLLLIANYQKTNKSITVKLPFPFRGSITNILTGERLFTYKTFTKEIPFPAVSGAELFILEES